MKYASFMLSTLCACLGGGFVAPAFADEPSVSSEQPVAATAAPAPAAPRECTIDESALLKLLTPVLQQNYVGDRGELELRLSRPWTALKAPDEPLTVKILELPNAGVTPACIVRFELRAADRCLGNWQVSLQAHVWREIWVARSAVKQGDLVTDADLARERRDVLTQRSPLADFAGGDSTLELAEPLQAGSPLLARSVRVRAIVHRGQTADALVQDGVLSVSMKVEILEDGAPGQVIRARNPQTRRNISGKVLNEQTILISL
jgi:flagella basal body P-ring formation protein FlgA